MSSLAQFSNILWGSLSIAAQAISLCIIVSLLLKRTPSVLAPLVGFFSRKAIFISFVISLLATVGSLIYSDVIGYEPCKLCWFQRIFMYPQVVLLALALWKKEQSIKAYAFVLSVIGLLVALYHYIGQLGWNPLGLDCLAIGYSASCSKNFVLQFGYITIPLMALSAFALMSLCLWKSLRDDKISATSVN